MTSGLKIAFAGTGSIGQRHLRNLLASEPDTQPIFLRAEARQDELSSSVGAIVASDIGELLNYEPDAIFISTPSALHGSILFAAIEANLPVYIEKPVVTSRADLDRV